LAADGERGELSARRLDRHGGRCFGSYEPGLRKGGILVRIRRPVGREPDVSDHRCEAESITPLGEIVAHPSAPTAAAGRHP
jgi:hypothetical protein